MKNVAAYFYYTGKLYAMTLPSIDSYDFIVIGRTFVLRIEKIIICN